MKRREPAQQDEGDPSEEAQAAIQLEKRETLRNMAKKKEEDLFLEIFSIRTWLTTLSMS